MTPEIAIPSDHAGNARFARLLSGTSEALYDATLLARDDWVVAPTLGAVVPGWLLIIPRRHFLNFRDSVANGGPTAPNVLSDVTRNLGLSLEDVIWFEHGPSRSNTVVGCGLDHAHVHVLVRPAFCFDEFERLVRTRADLGWTSTEAATAYSALKGSYSYLVAGSGDRAFFARDVDTAGSQFFRRIVAELVGRTPEWNYRDSPHLGNVEATVRMFRQLNGAARRER